MIPVEHWHIGRHFNGAGSIEESCPCPQLACGLVDSVKANEIDCPQHSLWSAKTIRSGHPADECPSQ